MPLLGRASACFWGFIGNYLMLDVCSIMTVILTILWNENNLCRFIIGPPISSTSGGQFLFEDCQLWSRNAWKLTLSYGFGCIYFLCLQVLVWYFLCCWEVVDNMLRKQGRSLYEGPRFSYIFFKVIPVKHLGFFPRAKVLKSDSLI